MKNKIISLILALSFLTVPVYAFTDISNENVNIAASSLASLGIVNGTGGNSYSPGRNLTRAEFSKLAVLALGDTKYETYTSFTIFPDVKNTHWASGYINSAVKQHKIIKGNADGTFKPDRTITLGESCTILLSMLGYKTEDIGAFWPTDYINKARAIGLLNGVSANQSSVAINRGDAAVMIRNLLLTNKKEGDILLKSSFSKVNDNIILIATSESDPNLAKNKAAFYENGARIEKETVSTIPMALIGSRGYAVYDNNQTNKILGFISTNNKSENFIVTKSYNDKIETKTQTLKPDNDAVVIVNGEKAKFSESWFDIYPDNKITIYYDENNKIDIIVVISDTVSANTFVYNGSNIPSSYKIIKNGVLVNLSDVKTYDVVSLNPSQNTAFVTNNKLTGYYEKGGPSYSNPSTVTVLGKEFHVSSSASKYFKNLSLGNKITLLLSSSGSVVGAYPADTVSAEMIGILTDVKGDIATISLLNGMKIEKKLSSSVGNSISGSSTYSNAWKYYRKLIKINLYSDETISFTELSPTKKSGDWDLDAGKIGTTKVLPTVTIFDRGAVSAPLVNVSISDVNSKLVKSSQIAGVLTDNAGNISTIILENVTGLANNYGITYGRSTTVKDGSFDGKEVSYEVYSIDLKTNEDKTLNYETLNLSGVSGGSPSFIPKYLENLPYKTAIPVKKLLSVGSVKLDAFNYSTSVKTNSGTYDIAKDIKVYITKQNKFVSLGEAKANYTNFILYADKTIAESGKIQFITAN